MCSRKCSSHRQPPMNRFESAWKIALTSLPRVDEFLADVPDPERSRPRSEMEQLDRQYRQFWDSGGDSAARRTAVQPPVVSVSRAAAPPAPQGTVDHRPV